MPPVLNNFMNNRFEVKFGDCKSSQYVNIKRQHKETIKKRCRLVDTIKYFAESGTRQAVLKLRKVVGHQPSN